ncbi:MAG: hypothetical protein ACK6DQ_10005, partial [Planctomycetota bacterium]
QCDIGGEGLGGTLLPTPVFIANRQVFTQTPSLLCPNALGKTAIPGRIRAVKVSLGHIRGSPLVLEAPKAILRSAPVITVSIR